jgi:hypothetical protein
MVRQLGRIYYLDRNVACGSGRTVGQPEVEDGFGQQCLGNRREDRYDHMLRSRNAHADQFPNQHTNGNADEHADEYTDEYTDSNAYGDCHEHADEYTYRNSHRNTDGNMYTERNTGNVV